MSIVTALAGILARIVERPLRLSAIVAAWLLSDLMVVRSAHAAFLQWAGEKIAPLPHYMIDAMIAVVVIAAFVYIVRLGMRLGALNREHRRSSENFGVALDNLTQGLTCFNGDGRLRFANRKYYELYKLDAVAQGPGTHISDILDARRTVHTFGEDKDAYLEKIIALAATRHVGRLINHLPDGRYIQVTHAPVPGGGWVATHEDISKHMMLRADLQQAKEFLQSIVRHVPAGLAVFNVQQDRYELINEAALRFYDGKSKDQIIGYAPEDVVSPELATRIRALDKAVLAERSQLYTAELTTTLGGDPATVLSRRAVVNDADGKPLYIIITLEDITRVRRLSEEVEQSRRFLENIIDSLPTAVIVKSAIDLRYQLVNNAFEQLTGKPREVVLGHAPREFYNEPIGREIEELDRRAVDGDSTVATVKTIFETANGVRRKLQTRRRVIRDANGQPQFVISTFEDITEQERLAVALQDSSQFLASVVDEIPIALLVKSIEDGTYVLCNREAEKVTNRPRREIIGKRLEDFARTRMMRDIAAQEQLAIASPGKVYTAEMPILREGKEPGLVLTRRVTIGDEGHPKYIVTTYDDITERRQNESRLAYLAYHDALTRLPNRSAFIHSLEQMIDSCGSEGERFSVLSVDLDRFKEINDVCGHQFGDKLLSAVAERIQVAAGGAVVARLSGDEFALLVDGEQPEAGRRLAQRLIETMKDEFLIDGQTTRCSLTCGVSIFPDDGSDAASLLANADAALHRAKSDARGSVRFFEAEMDQRLRTRRALHHDLGSAIKNNELLLHYQPQAIASGEFVGFEALVRWKHPARGMVSPGDFIPVAEESGLIVEMGEWILREACREAASWAKPLQISVNLSPVQFQHGDLVGLVHSILLDTGLSPARLELEITEGVLIRDFDRGVSLLRRLKALGVKIAMDDFGSGYSSLAYLQAFPFDKIKIDRDFVMNLGRNRQSAAIVRAVIGLGHGLDVPIVAEGVETQDQLAFLIEESCDQFQGYFLGKPAPIATYAKTIGRSEAEAGADAAVSRAG